MLDRDCFGRLETLNCAPKFAFKDVQSRGLQRAERAYVAIQIGTPSNCLKGRQFQRFERSALEDVGGEGGIEPTEPVKVQRFSGAQMKVTGSVEAAC